VQGWLPEYFISRDVSRIESLVLPVSLIVFLIHGVDKSEHLVTMQVTMNEVLVIKESPDRAVLYYSRDALRDVQLQLVRLQLSPRIALV
jgi:hypothetical protein